MGRICLNFAVTLVLATIAIIIISILLEIYAGMNTGAGVSFVPAMVAALVAGQLYASRTKTMPTSKFSWRAALWMSFTALAIGIVMFGLFLIIGSARIIGLLQGLDMTVILIALGVVMAIQFLSIRFFFGMGASQATRAQDQKTRQTF
ncbi:MAG: ABZJ_00895 family protein [Paracoccaceae bacterium]